MRYLITTFILFNFFLVIAVAAPERDQILKLLEGRHWILNSDVFQRLGDSTDRILIEIAEDDSLINYLRFRAIEALSLFPTENTAVYLEKTTKKTNASLSRRGFETFKKSFAESHPDRLKKLANDLLNHKNPQLRISGARVIRSMDAPRFKQFLESEKDMWVRRESQK